MLSAELLRELTQFLIERPERFEFSNGCKAWCETDDPEWIWLSSPYGVDSAISGDARELKQRLKSYLSFWSESRNEQGDLLS